MQKAFTHWMDISAADWTGVFSHRIGISQCEKHNYLSDQG